MQTTIPTKRYTPGSVPVASQVKVYYSTDVEEAGGVDEFLKSIGSDKAKSLPEINFSDNEWQQMLQADF